MLPKSLPSLSLAGNSFCILINFFIGIDSIIAILNLTMLLESGKIFSIIGNKISDKDFSNVVINFFACVIGSALFIAVETALKTLPLPMFFIPSSTLNLDLFSLDLTSFSLTVSSLSFISCSSNLVV